MSAVSTPKSFDFTQIQSPIQKIVAFSGNTKMLTVLKGASREKAYHEAITALQKSYQQVVIEPSPSSSALHSGANAYDRLENAHRTALGEASRDPIYQEFLKERAKLGLEKPAEGFQTFKLFQAYKIHRALESLNICTVQNLLVSNEEERSSYFERFGVSRTSQVEAIYDHFTKAKEVLKLANEQQLMNSLPNSLNFFKSDDVYRRISYLKFHREEAMEWIKTDPQVQACHVISVDDIRHFRIPEWVNLIPSLGAIRIEASNDLRFDFCHPNVYCIAIIKSKNLSFNKDSYKGLLALLVKDSCNIHFRNFASNLERLLLEETNGVVLGKHFTVQNLQSILHVNPSYEVVKKTLFPELGAAGYKRISDCASSSGISKKPRQ